MAAPTPFIRKVVLTSRDYEDWLRAGAQGQRPTLDELGLATVWACLESSGRYKPELAPTIAATNDRDTYFAKIKARPWESWQLRQGRRDNLMVIPIGLMMASPGYMDASDVVGWFDRLLKPRTFLADA